MIYESSGHCLRSLVLPASFIKHGFAPDMSQIELENFGLSYYSAKEIR